MRFGIGSKNWAYSEPWSNRRAREDPRTRRISSQRDHGPRCLACAATVCHKGLGADEPSDDDVDSPPVACRHAYKIEVDIAPLMSSKAPYRLTPSATGRKNPTDEKAGRRYAHDVHEDQGVDQQNRLGAPH